MTASPLARPSRPLRRLFALTAIALALAWGLTSGTARAEGFAAPSDDVMLTISGSIGQTNTDGALALDRALLDALPQQEFATSTIWTEGVITFRGVLLRDLLQAGGASGATVTLTALNDYSIQMPAADASDAGPLLAYLMNGAPMSVREKGPVWLVYPYDADAAFRTEQTYARSIWQLVRIEVHD